MSIHLQKIIRFIPIVNTITLFFWIKMYCQKKLKISDFLKAFFTMVLVLFVVAIPQMISDRVVSNGKNDKMECKLVNLHKFYTLYLYNYPNFQ